MAPQSINSAIRVILCNLPKSQQGWWVDTHDLFTSVKRGGFLQLTEDKFVLAMRGWRCHSVFSTNMFGSRMYYCFGDPNQKRFKNYQDQRESLVKHPRMSPNFFLGRKRGKAVHQAVEVLCGDGLCRCQPTMMTELPDDITESTSSDTDGQSTLIRTGLKVVDIDVEDEFLERLWKHAVECGHKMHKLEFKPDRDKLGFDARYFWKCPFCKCTLEQHSGWDVHRQNGQRGSRPMSGLNAAIANAAYETGVSQGKALKLFGNAGIRSPTERGFTNLIRRVKSVAVPVSQEQLSANRRNHVARIRQLESYLGDIKFTSSDRKRRSIARGPISADGCGSVRAYSHRITGSQHGLVAYSCITDEPLYVECDQISCWGCSHKLTEYLSLTGKKVCDIQDGEVNFNHDGHCYRNSRYSPAKAEEYAMERAGEYLLDLPDDEAIFGEEVITDGDTRGTNRFIQKQVDIIGAPAVGIAQHLPDIGHFIKCISNGFYKIAAEDSTVNGKDLLEPARIKALSGDVRRHLKWYHSELAKIRGNDSNARQLHDVARNICLAKIDSIIPHHCGNHSSCHHEDCGFVDCLFCVRTHYEVTKQNASDAAIQREVKLLYAKKARFQVPEGGLIKNSLQHLCSGGKGLFLSLFHNMVSLLL